MDALRNDDIQNDVREFYKRLNIPSNNPELTGCSFSCLPVIDPTRLDNTESVMDVVLSLLFDAIRCEFAGQNNKETFEKLAKKIQPVFQAVRNVSADRAKLMQNDVDADLSLEVLDKLASSHQLRKNLRKFVATYLDAIDQKNEYSHKSPLERFLVISIDDIDMNLRHGFDAMEEIRKYFMMPNVIVLCAAYHDQLSSLIEANFRRELSIDKSDEAGNRKIVEMASKYINKIMPSGRRCRMPDFNDIASAKVQINGGDDTPLLRTWILELIRKKTGVVLVPNGDDFHGIVPRNLRSLLHLHELLNAMKDTDELVSMSMSSMAGATDLRSHLRENLSAFEDYLISYHRNTMVNPELSDLLREFGATPSIAINHLIARKCLKLIVVSQDDPLAARIDQIRRASEHPYALCIGDILYLLQLMERLGSIDDAERFAAVIKTLYSCRLMQCCFSNMDMSGLRRMLGGRLFSPWNTNFMSRTDMPDKDGWFKNVDISKAMVSHSTSLRTFLQKTARDAEIADDIRNENWDNISAELNRLRFANEGLWEELILSQFFTVYYGNVDDQEKWMLSDPYNAYYENRPTSFKNNIGTVKNISYHMMQLFVNLLDPVDSCDRLLDSLFSSSDYVFSAGTMQPGASKSLFAEAFPYYDDIVDWQEKNVMAIPLYSVEFIEKYMMQIQKNKDIALKERINNTKDYCSRLIWNMRRSFREVVNMIYDDCDQMGGVSTKTHVTNRFDEIHKILLERFISETNDSRFFPNYLLMRNTPQSMTEIRKELQALQTKIDTARARAAPLTTAINMLSQLPELVRTTDVEGIIEDMRDILKEISGPTIPKTEKQEIKKNIDALLQLLPDDVK